MIIQLEIGILGIITQPETPEEELFIKARHDHIAQLLKDKFMLARPERQTKININNAILEMFLDWQRLKKAEENFSGTKTEEI